LNRSATPLVSGSATYPKLGDRLQNFSSFRKCSEVYCVP